MGKEIHGAEPMPFPGRLPIWSRSSPGVSSMAHSLRRDFSSFSFVAAISIVMFFVLCMPAARAAETNAAQAFVQQNVDKVNALLDDPSMSVDQRRVEFGRLLLSMADTRRIAMFVLGQYANGPMPEQLSAFQSAFTDYALAAYEAQLVKLKGGRIMVTGAMMRAPDDFIVNAEIIKATESENGGPLKLAVRVRAQPDGSFVMTDMQFEGVWLAISQRADFTSFLQQHRGDISALTGSLRSKTPTISATGRGSRPAG
jgi:phospholipid transport system substrate-binding protein